MEVLEHTGRVHRRERRLTPVLTVRDQMTGSSWSQEEAPPEVTVPAEVHRWSVQWGSSPGAWGLPLGDQTSWGGVVVWKG